jgi:hypothetical protein
MTPLQQAIDWFQERSERKNGGRSAMAKFLKVAPGAITYWDYKGQIPKQHVQKLSAKTGIPKSVLRPDLWR